MKPTPARRPPGLVGLAHMMRLHGANDGTVLAALRAENAAKGCPPLPDADLVAIVRGRPETAVAQAPPPADPPAPPTSVETILAYFREVYRPLYREGRTAVVTADGEPVHMATAVATPTSEVIRRLAAAADAPRFARGGNLNESALPGHYAKWAKVAWGDLVAALPDEDGAALGADSAPGEAFRRLVRDALLSELTLAGTIGESEATQVERRSLIDWCEKFAKAGPWRSIRSKKCWCKTEVLGGGEILLRVAVRVELFAQLKADRRLCVLTQPKFAARCERYGVGHRGGRDDRPEGGHCVVLHDAFVTSLRSGVATDDPPHPPER